MQTDPDFHIDGEPFVLIYSDDDSDDSIPELEEYPPLGYINPSLYITRRFFDPINNIRNLENQYGDLYAPPYIYDRNMHIRYRQERDYMVDIDIITARACNTTISEQDALWLMAAGNKRVSNTSITGYSHIRHGTMWIPDIYQTIITFLSNEDHHKFWIAHKVNTYMSRPNPNKYKTVANPQYIIWSNMQLPIQLTICIYTLNNYYNYILKKNLSNKSYYLKQNDISSIGHNESVYDVRRKLLYNDRREARRTTRHEERRELLFT
jgi:hypothetical protein